MISNTLATLLLASGLASATTSAPLTSSPGQKIAIPSWDLTSSSDVSSNNLASLSRPGLDTSSWYHAKTSRCTIMGCLLDAAIYNDTDLWFSDNLNHINWGQFTVPWLYRHEFALSPASGKHRHYLLQTNGITSKADLFLNGRQIADSTLQSGSYVGHTYDITSLAAEDNALVIQVYPTNYAFDLAIGFVDWNPYPADNGTGVWREITVKETGPVSMGPITVLVDIETPVEKAPAEVTIRAMAQNLEDSDVEVAAEAIVTDDNGCQGQPIKQTVFLGPHESKIVEFKQTLSQPKIWWPKQWGSQPLYTANVTFSVDSALSDSAGTKFGIRKVTSVVNRFNDIQFSVNGHPFQVLGGGYSADMFLRWDGDRFTRIAQYMLDMNQNTVRLEGKMEHPELYEIADQLGLMVLPGWECCDKWEAWSYKNEPSTPVWDKNDYQIANASMIHEAEMIQSHPSILGFLIGSDYWPDDQATQIYLAALKNSGWQTPIVSSAGTLGYPEQLGPSGMKMAGPYDWVPPNYWYDVEPSEKRLGAAFGFGSELGAGVGTPELGSLRQFLNHSDMEDLWKKPNKDLFHMSTNVSSFYNRRIYNQGLWNRYGAPTSLDDYLLKAQMMDYEAIRSQYEGFSAFWTAYRPATGLIYWMLNNAWPSLHWNQFDYYFHPAGSYYGTKVGSRIEHVAYNYLNKSVWVINHSLDQQGPRNIDMELIDLSGEPIAEQTISVDAKVNSGFKAADISSQISKISQNEVAFLRLKLSNASGTVLSRNIYWLTNSIDEPDWDRSSWYSTPVAKFVDYTPLNSLKTANVSITASRGGPSVEVPDTQTRSLVLENKSAVPAFFIRLTLVDKSGNDVNPVMWSDNYVTLWPHETLTVQVSQWGGSGEAVQISGKNVEATTVTL